jgi:hypothetical protein
MMDRCDNRCEMAVITRTARGQRDDALTIGEDMRRQLNERIHGTFRKAGVNAPAGQRCCVVSEPM